MSSKTGISSKYRSSHLLDHELTIFAIEDRDELAAQGLPVLLETPPDLATLRQLREQMDIEVKKGMSDPAPFNVTREEIFAPCEGGPDVRCLLYVPQENKGPQPAYLWLHGGGYVVGCADQEDLRNLKYAQKLNAVICSVDYRMGPEDPIPAPLDDAYAGLAWLHQNADRLNVDADRIAIGGESAGGGLAAALAILARDRGEYPICHQHLSCPMLDSRVGSPEHPADPLTGEFVWTAASNQFGWKCHLGDAPAAAPQVPSLLEDFSNLPSTWIHTSGLDIFRDENIAYASALLKAGVRTELVVEQGGPHGYQLVPNTKICAKFFHQHLSALAKALGVEL